jgi:hypothetical protein
MKSLGVFSDDWDGKEFLFIVWDLRDLDELIGKL